MKSPTRLKSFGVLVTGVRRSASDEPDVIGPDAWRSRLGEFDWIVLAAAADLRDREDDRRG